MSGVNSVRERRLLTCCVCVAGLLFIYGPVFYTGISRVLAGADDFLAFYAGARLAGSPSLYDPAAAQRIQLEAAHTTGPSLLYIRLPWFAAVLWPLAQLPYAIAHGIWFALRFAAVFGFILIWRFPEKAVSAAVCCWSLPLAAALANAQDSPFLILWIAVSLMLENSGRPFWAGAILALCTAKFHLFLLLPVLLLAHRKWAVMAGGAAGCGVLAALCWIAGGWDWPARYVQTLALSSIEPSAHTMPNFHGLLPAPWELPVTVLALLVCIFAIFKLEYLEALAVALAGGLLIGRHAYVQDAVILIPAILIVWSKTRSRAARYAAIAAATPIPWIALLRRGG